MTRTAAVRVERRGVKRRERVGRCIFSVQSQGLLKAVSGDGEGRNAEI